MNKLLIAISILIATAFTAQAECVVEYSQVKREYCEYSMTTSSSSSVLALFCVQGNLNQGIREVRAPVEQGTSYESTILLLGFQAQQKSVAGPQGPPGPSGPPGPQGPPGTVNPPGTCPPGTVISPPSPTDPHIGNNGNPSGQIPCPDPPDPNRPPDNPTVYNPPTQPWAPAVPSRGPPVQ